MKKPRRKHDVGYVYKITNLINKKVYIGKTTDVIERIFDEHLEKLNLKKHKNKHLQSSWLKYGQQNFQIEVIYSEIPEHLLSFMEISTIAWYNSSDPMFGFNKTDGGEGCIPNEQTRKKMSEISSDRQKKPEERKKSSERQKEIQNRQDVKIKKSETMKMKGETHHMKNPEIARKVSNAKTGVEFSDEHKKNISKNHADFSGEKNPMYNNGKFAIRKTFHELVKILNTEFSDTGIEATLTEDDCLRVRLSDKIIEVDQDFNVLRFKEEYPDLSDDEKDALMENCMDKIDALRHFFEVFSPENDEQEFYSKFFQHFSELELEIDILKEAGIISELDFENENTEFISQTFHSSSKSKSRNDN